MIWLLLLAIPRAELFDFVDEVEINTFGAPPRTALIYRTAGEIIDWRWFSHRDQIPSRIALERYCAIWEDSGQLRTVMCRSVVRTRTAHDVELEERKILPNENRRKLSTLRKR